MNASANANGTSWWQRQRWYLLGAVLLGAAALYPSYRDNERQRAVVVPRVATDVAPGQWVDYAGARWRLIGLVRYPHPNLMLDAAIVVAQFEMTLDPGAHPDLLDRCRGQIGDGQGRVWPDDIGLRAAGVERLPGYCRPRFATRANAAANDPRLGEPWRFDHAYVVPKRVDLAHLRPEIFVPWDPSNTIGRYLRFTAPQRETP